MKIKTKTRERRLYFQNMLLSMWRYFRVNINKKPKNLSHRYYLFPHKSPFFTLIDPLKQHTFSKLWYQIKSVRLWTIKYIKLKQQQHSSSSQAKQSNCQNIFLNTLPVLQTICKQRMYSILSVQLLYFSSQCFCSLVHFFIVYLFSKQHIISRLVLLSWLH